MLPEERTRLLLKAFGWQGGTIHQLAEETGCSVQDLLYKDMTPTERHLLSSDASGWSAARTCTIEFNIKVNFPKRKGDIEFWFGVIRGLELKERGC